MIGDCICSYAVTDAEVIASLNPTGLNFTIPASDGGDAISTGTLTEIQWNIDEYQSGAQISQTNGNLNAGDPDAFVSFTNGAATYVVRITYIYDDGASITTVIPFELDGGGVVRSVSWASPNFSLTCRYADIQIGGLNVPAGRTYVPAWFDGDFNILQYGQTYAGNIPDQAISVPINIGFSVGLDVAQWSDLPSIMNSWEIAAFGCAMIEC